MKPVVLTPLTKEVIMESTGNPIQLSPEREREIEEFWLEINNQQSFHRGKVFTIHSMKEHREAYKILLDDTDYAHYLHTIKNHKVDEEGCQVVFGAGLVETRDARFVFGEMAPHTAHPGRLQCAGGGLEETDKKGNYFDIKGSVLREVAEELGIHRSNMESCSPVFIKRGGTYDSVVILYHIKVNLTKKEWIEDYQTFIHELTKQGEKPEFQNVICIKNCKEAITDFFENDDRQREDYLKPLLEYMASN